MYQALFYTLETQGIQQIMKQSPDPLELSYCSYRPLKGARQNHREVAKLSARTSLWLSGGRDNQLD